MQELKELESSLATASPLNVYVAPAGYFDGLAGEILNRIQAMEAADSLEEMKILSGAISNMPVVNPYSVPAGYFEKLPENLLKLVSNTAGEQTTQQELEALSPLLNSLRKEAPYKVPAGYFDQLNAPATRKEETKVISLVNRKWFRYAAAALVIAFVASIGFLFLNKKENIDPSEKSFAWVEKSMKKVSTDEINQFVEMTDDMAPVVASTSEKDVIKELVKNIPAEEIQDFLNDVASTDTEDVAADEEIFN